MKFIKPLIFLVAIIVQIGSGTTIAQQLDRISISERSDGNGFVMRFHLTEMVDSFSVARPDVNLVQMSLYAEDISESNIVLIQRTNQIPEVKLSTIEGGIGVDITIAEHEFFLTDAYPDVNQSDLLLSLQYAPEEDVLVVVDENARTAPVPGEEPPETEQKNVEPEEIPEAGEDINETAEESVQEQPEKNRKITTAIGVQVGASLASVEGDGFSKDVRQGVTYGLAVSILFPYELPYNVKPGVETGVFFTQKGFENPSQEYLNAQTVEFDYIEVPVMGKLSYPLHNLFSPYIIAGPSFAFMVNAERIRISDERRLDLDDRTYPFEITGTLGGGFDLKLQEQIINVQLKGIYSFKDVFKSQEDSVPADSFTHRYISIELGFRF